MKVTVIIPTIKGRERLLEEAIKSVKNQTYRNIQLIVKSGGTLGKNINEAAKLAEGEYIKILADDDLLPPDAIAKMVKCAGAGVIYGDALYRYGTVDSLLKGKYTGLYDLARKVTFCGAATMYRADMFRGLKGWDESLTTGEELEFHLRCAANGYDFAYCPHVVYIYRQHGGSKSRMNDKKKRNIEIESWRKKYREL